MGEGALVSLNLDLTSSVAGSADGKRGEGGGGGRLGNSLFPPCPFVVVAFGLRCFPKKKLSRSFAGGVQRLLARCRKMETKTWGKPLFMITASKIQDWERYSQPS